MSDEIDLEKRGAELQRLSDVTAELDRSAERVGRTLATSLARGAVEGRKLEDVLRGVALRLSESALSSALRPATQAITGGLSSLLGQFGASLAGGGGTPPVVPFAEGGVLAAPTYFPMGRAIGLAGEAGPEAIMPLSRGPDGRLGVRAGGGGAAPVHVTMSITTPDADSFRRSEAQLAASLSRALARGVRAS